MGARILPFVWFTVLTSVDSECGVVDVTLKQVCGKGKHLPISPNDTLVGLGVLDCVGHCGRDDRCKGVNFNSLGVSTCEVFLYDVISPCDITENDPNSRYYRQIETLFCQNGGSLRPSRTSCDCPGMWMGSFCERYPRDCQELYEAGRGVTQITLQITGVDYPVSARCYLQYTFTSWNRGSPGNFARSWAEFRDGFADPTDHLADYWIGNTNLHCLTAQAKYSIDTNFRFIGHFIMDNCRVGDEAENFTLAYTVGTHPSSNIPGTYTDQSNLSFTTYDRDNACAEQNYNANPVVYNDGQTSTYGSEVAAMRGGGFY